MDWLAIVLLLHVASAMAWFGGSLFMVTRFGPAMRCAGPAALPVQACLLRRGGISRYFVPVALLNVASGATLYIAGHWWAGGSVQGVMMNVGVASGTAALVVGMTRSGPAEARMHKAMERLSAGSADAAEEMGRLAAQAGQASRIILGLLSIAFLGMMGRVLVA